MDAKQSLLPADQLAVPHAYSNQGAAQFEAVRPMQQMSPQEFQQRFYRNSAPLLKGIVNGRPMFGQVDIFLDGNEQVLADAGSMTWMDGSLSVETTCHGGCGAACGRCMSSESCCLNTFTGPGRVGFAMDLPGDVMAFATTPEFGWILSQGAFVCGTANLKVSGRFAGCGAACCSGEGLFLTRVSTENGPGLFFASGFGSIKRHIVPPGKIFFVERGLFFAAEQHTQLNIGLMGSLKTLFCTPDAIVMRFQGPCTVYTQSRNPSILQAAQAEPQNGPGAI